MNTCNGCKYFSDSVTQIGGEEKGTYKVYACQESIPSRLLYSTFDDHNVVPVPSDCPLPRWKYHSKNVKGGLHDAVKWLNENANQYDVVEMKSISGTMSEFGYSEGCTIIVWREKNETN